MEKTKEFNYKIDKCTPRALRIYHEQGLDSMDGTEFLKNLSETLINAEKTEKLAKALWPNLPEDFNFEEDLDVEKFREAILFFGMRSLGILRGSGVPAQN